MASLDMWRYGSHARGDAIEILGTVRELVGLPHARGLYEKYDTAQLMAYEEKYAELIGQFLAKTVSQRPAFLRRITKTVSQDDLVFFLIMCAQAALRVHRFFEVHDRYAHFLIPGAGYRAATQGVFEFIREVDQTADDAWPRDLIWEAWPGADDEDLD